MATSSDDAWKAFLQANADLTPLRADPRAPNVIPTRSSSVQRVRHAENAAPDDAATIDYFSDPPDPSAADLDAVPAAFCRPGIDRQSLRRLRRGHWPIQADLDLHGQNVDESRYQLGLFLRECHHHQWRCVRIIHGKGLSSPGGVAILKGKVLHWLTQCDTVLAFVEARLPEGGSGATVLLLKR